jgi:polar amino acid transport system substrate-binding protein
VGNRHFLKKFAAPLHLVFLAVSLALPSVALGSTRLIFAFSEAAAPYSSSTDQRAVGLFPDLVQLAFSFVPDYTTASVVLPWARAQYNVRQGIHDGLLTYPSEERRDYAIFSAKPLFTQDFGHLVYSADNPNVELIESATSFADLSSLTVIVEKGSKWEEDNIPGYLVRLSGQSMTAMMHFLMLRGAGDFMVQPAEDASFIARQLGYSKRLRIRKVDFIPNSQIPFHIGISRKFPSAGGVIDQVDAALRNPEFQSQLDTLIENYR